MDEKISLGEVVDLFVKPSDPCDYGCDENELDAIWERVTTHNPEHKNMYAVKHWTWHDIDIDDEHIEVVKADYVLRTDNTRFNIGDWVRTSPILAFTHNCLCETASSFYILVGTGTRKKSKEALFSFFG